MPASSDVDPLASIRARVRAAIAQAWTDAVAQGRIPAVEDPAAAPAVEIDRPANPAFGDLATNLAMKLAKPLRRAPMEIAEALAATLPAASNGLIASAEAARPGFLNLRVADGAFESLVAAILDRPAIVVIHVVTRLEHGIRASNRSCG